MADQAESGDPYVFLSYTTPDRPRVLALTDRLEARGIKVWVDRRNIAGGSNWDEAIVEAIRLCAVLVVLGSRAAMTSSHVLQELRLAQQFGKPVLPLLVEPVNYPPAVEYILAGRQWIELLDHPEEVWLTGLLRALALFDVRARAADAGVSTTPPTRALGATVGVEDRADRARRLYPPTRRWRWVSASMGLAVLVFLAVLGVQRLRTSHHVTPTRGAAGVLSTLPTATPDSMEPLPIVSEFKLYGDPASLQQEEFEVRDRFSACFTLQPTGGHRPLVLVATEVPTLPLTSTDSNVVARSEPVEQVASGRCYDVRTLKPAPALATYWVYLLDGSAVMATSSFSVKPKADDVLLQDDFTDPARTNTFNPVPLAIGYETGYDAGEYVFKDTASQRTLAGALLLRVSAANVAVAVDARLVGDPANRVVVVGCRLGPQGGYNLQVDPNAGSFSIARLDIADGVRAVPLVDWQPAAAIVRGNGTNRLLLRCAGSHRTASVNGVQLASIEDTIVTAGFPFLYGGARVNESGLSETRFAHLLVVRQ